MYKTVNNRNKLERESVTLGHPIPYRAPITTVENKLPMIATAGRWATWVSLVINIILCVLVIFVLPIEKIMAIQDFLLIAFGANCLVIILYLILISIPLWKAIHGR